MSSLKIELRDQLKSARLSISENDRQVKSLKIEKGLQTLVDWSSVRALHLFEPILGLGEVDISGFVSYLKINYSTIEIFTTRQFSNKWKVTPFSDSNRTIDPKFDVVLVPMLGFDDTLHRIGYGGGYYDKFLSAQSQAQKIGICFEKGRIKKMPFEPHDIAMDAIITESTIYS